MERKITTVVFDIGSVLNDFHWKEAIWGRHEKETAEKLIEVFSCGLWKEMDLGVKEETEILKEFQALAPGMEELVEKEFYRIGECKFSYEYSSRWILELKRDGYRVLFLSNYSRHLLKTSPHSVDFLPLMEGGVFSWEVHLLKPDSGIYEALFERYDLIPEECIFIDDRKENVEAAIRLGMHGIWFEGYESAYEKTEALLKRNRSDKE